MGHTYLKPHRASGFEKLTQRHARTKHWLKFWRSPQGRLLRQQGNADVCHGCHEKGTSHKVLLHGDLAIMLCPTCVDAYVKGVFVRHHKVRVTSTAVEVL